MKARWMIAGLVTITLAVSSAMATGLKGEVTWRAPAWDVTAVGERVVVLEEDFLHIKAIDPQKGKILWRTKFQNKDPRGMHSLIATESGRLFVYAGPQLIEVDPQNGKEKGRLTTVWNRHECRLKVRGTFGAVLGYAASNIVT